MGFLLTILIGIGAAMLLPSGLDVNMTADVRGTASGMLQADIALRAKAYIGVLLFLIQALIFAGLYILLKRHGNALALWSLLIGVLGLGLSLLGAVLAMTAAGIAKDAAFAGSGPETRLSLLSLQAMTDYTSFHLSLIISSVANAGFFYLFLKSRLIPRLIAGWGLFASLFVASMIIARDFIPALGADSITIAFMICNLIALVLTGLYLLVRGIRETSSSATGVLPQA